MGKSLLHEVLLLGVNSKASDWHIKEGCPVNLRIAGALVGTDLEPDSEFMENIIHQMTNDDQYGRYCGAGDVDLSYVEDDVGRFRVNIHRQRGFHSMTLRHVKT